MNKRLLALLACLPLPVVAAPRDLLLAIDQYAFPLRQHVALYLTKPDIQAQPVLGPSPTPGAPDDVAAHFDATVIHDNGKFRMWYYALHATTPAGTYELSPPCYAESEDGIHWTRPDLGQVEWSGNRHNNCLAIGDTPTRGSNGCYVIRDDDDPQAARRYKMVYGVQGKTSNVATAVSPDGLHWTLLPHDVTHGQFAEVGSFYRYRGLYLVNAHNVLGAGEGGRTEGRQGYVWISPDFEHWLPEPGPSFLVAEPLVGSGTGTHGHTGGLYTQDHIGVGVASFGNVAVGLWGMWRNRQPNWGEGGINCDLGLLISHDGLHFDEVVKGQPYIRSTESPADPLPGRHYPTILIQANGILDVGDRTYIYHGRWRNVAYKKLSADGVRFRDIAPGYWGAIALATLPRDRWGSLRLAGDSASGTIWTDAVRLPPDAHLDLNAAGLGGIRVDVADDRFQPLAGYESGRATGAGDDAFAARAGWNGASLDALAGRSVRFHIHLSRAGGAPSPRLFALTVGGGR